MASYEDEVNRRQQQLAEAKRAGDTDGEIEALLGIGEAALEEAPDLAFSHFRLAEKVIRGAKSPGRLHEAIGGQGKAFRRNKRFEKAIERYSIAEAAAAESGNEAAQVRWMLRRASALRSLKQMDAAKAVVTQAEQVLRPAPKDEPSLMSFIGRVNFLDKAAVGTLAELEGQIGLTLINEHDEQGAEDHYRSATYFAGAAEDWRAVNTWGTNVGNACVRRGRYGEAFAAYEKALSAALKEGHGSGILNTAMGLADGFARAYRHEEGGDRLRALAVQVEDERSRLALLDRALALFDEGVCAEKAIETAQQIEAMAVARPVNPEFLAQVKSVRKKMEGLAQMSATAGGPPALDLLLPEFMVRAEKSGSVDRAWQAAQTVCDVRLALALAGGKHWARMVGGDILTHPGLDLRVVFDTLQMLLKAGESERAIELLQRFKAPSFCVPFLRRLLASGAPPKEAQAYLDAVRGLCAQVEALAGPAKPDFIRVVNAVRREAERMREAGEALRDADPILLARLGGPVRRDELIDTLPFGGGVGIVDFFVGRDATVIVALTRSRDGVVAIPSIAPSFTAAHAEQLATLYAEGNLPKQLGGAHTKALMAISKILHDRLFCGLAKRLSEFGINQLILIPDILTRNLPLHLSYACGKEFSIPGIDTQDAGFLCEVMPIEYAPCLQAVAASQGYLRPKKIERIAAFADPAGDLPGVRTSMQEFGSRTGHPDIYHLTTGAAVTKAAVAQALPEADIMMLGTHGGFSAGDLEQTHLVLHGAPWTVADMAAMSDLQKRALLVLVACEAGAIAATPDDGAAWGIPGALIGAGASAVVANLWPVEDITSNILFERFLVHLAHPGYRPAAALFRAVRDLRRMSRDEALAYCREYLDRLKKAKATPRVLVGARAILDWIEDHDDAQPFGHPFFWGATVVVGSGWHLPAGAVVGPPQVTTENLLKQAEADALVAAWKPRQALELARQVAASADGASRGRAYATMALALLRSADLGTTPRVRQEATRLLKHADRFATLEDDDDLRSRVRWVSAQMEDEHVVQKNN